MRIKRIAITSYQGMMVFLSLLLLWQCLIHFFELPPYILPSPLLVFKSFYQSSLLLIQNMIPTIIESLLGLTFSILLGSLAAITMLLFKPFKYWLLPILLISQALPTFAIAPLLVIWFGYGISSKIVTTIIMLFFPITSSFFDGLQRTPKIWLDLANIASSNRILTLRYIQVPAALPALASGIRVATAFAPIGAVIGEWVGASRGLGFLILNANARMQIDLMFAALFILIIYSLLLYFIVDRLLKIMIPWEVHHYEN